MILSAPEKALAGNPVVVTVLDIPNDNSLALTVSDSSGQVVWRGVGFRNATGECTFDIADVVRELVAFNRLIDGGLDWKSYVIRQFEHRVQVSARIATAEGDTVGETFVRVFAGGITREMLRRLAAEETDIFAKKYEALDANYILSTRTYSKVITLEAREVAPLWFKTHGENILIKDLTTGEEIGFTETASGSGVSIINLPKFLADAERKHGAFAFYTEANGSDYILSFYVVVNKPRATKESYLLEFRNSYGAYERIELTGRALSEPEYTDPRSYALFDALTGSLVNAADRRERTDQIKASYGWRDKESLMFFRDMLQSDDIVLLGPSGAWVKVLVEPDGDTVPLLITEPTSNNLIIKFADPEDYYLPDLYLGTNEEMPDVPVSIWSKGYWDAAGWWLDDSFWKE